MNGEFHSYGCCREGRPFLTLLLIGGILTIHRADVQQVFLKHLGPNCHIHLSRRLVSYTESKDRIQLKFEDRSTASCDLVVGADGLNSVVRKLLLKKLSGDHTRSIKPSWSGSVAYRGLISSELLAQHLPGHRALKNPMMVGDHTLYLRPSRSHIV